MVHWDFLFSTKNETRRKWRIHTSYQGWTSVYIPLKKPESFQHYMRALDIGIVRLTNVTNKKPSLPVTTDSSNVHECHAYWKTQRRHFNERRTSFCRQWDGVQRWRTSKISWFFRKKPTTKRHTCDKHWYCFQMQMSHSSWRGTRSSQSR